LRRARRSIRASTNREHRCTRSPRAIVRAPINLHHDWTINVLGAIAAIRATFHVPVRDPTNIRMNYATAGGVTMDIGCYPIS
jgi:hypothetical protein